MGRGAEWPALPRQRQPVEQQSGVAAALAEFRAVHAALRRGAQVLAHATVGGLPPDRDRVVKVAGLADLVQGFVRDHDQDEHTHWWPALGEAGVDVGAALRSLTADHRSLYLVLDTVRALAAALRERSDDALAWTALTREAGRLRRCLEDHLDAEEPVLFPLLATRLTDADATRLAALRSWTASRAGLSYVVGFLAEAPSPDDAEHSVAALPLSVRLMRPVLIARYHRDLALVTGNELDSSRPPGSGTPHDEAVGHPAATSEGTRS